MRKSFAAVLIAFTALLSAPVGAAPSMTDVARAEPSSNIVEAGGRCGPHQHWVRAHRNRHGKRIAGHCARNRH